LKDEYATLDLNSFNFEDLDKEY